MTDISSLSTLKKLRIASFDSYGIKDASVIFENMLDLTDLNLGGTQVKELSGITNLQKLQVFNIYRGDHYSLNKYLKDILSLPKLDTIYVDKKQLDINELKKSGLNINENGTRLREHWDYGLHDLMIRGDI